MTSPWNKDYEVPPRKPTLEEQIAARGNSPEDAVKIAKNLRRYHNKSIEHLALFNEAQQLLGTSDQEFWAALAFAKGAARAAAEITGTTATASEEMWKFMEDLGYRAIKEDKR